MTDHSYTDPFLRVIRRARIVFIIVILLVLSGMSSSVFLGWQSGEFERRLFTPVRRAVTSFAEIMSEEPSEPESSPSGIWKKYVDVTPAPGVKEGNATVKQKVIINVNSTGGTVNRDAVKKMNDDAAAAKAAQDAWWEQQQQQFEAVGQQNQANFDAANARAQQDMEAFQQESQAKVDAFKKANGF